MNVWAQVSFQGPFQPGLFCMLIYAGLQKPTSATAFRLLWKSFASDSVAGSVTECKCVWRKCVFKTAFQTGQIYLLPFPGVLWRSALAECGAGFLLQAVRTCRCWAVPPASRCLPARPGSSAPLIASRFF